MEVVEVMKTVRSLTRDQRADLAYQVLLSLEDDDQNATPSEVDTAWADAIRRRVDDHRAGRVALVDLEESHAQLREELTRSHQ